MEELNDFLPENHKREEINYLFNGNPTVKHLIESIGIPHTEIGDIVINGRVVDLTSKVENKDKVLVSPKKKYPNGINGENNIHDVLGNPRFVLDNHLGKLAVYLRMFGLDTLYSNDFQDELLTEIASKNERILLTRDRELLKRKVIIYGYWIRNIKPILQIKEIINRYDLGNNLRLFNRCLKCNNPLHKIEKARIINRLEPLTREHYNEFYYCNNCDQVYWKGSHYQRMLDFMTSILNRGE